ncbi:MAG: dockerin type I repeat-containing protein [Ruminococcus sp.]|nr:dockerin type I repeat-containing protein [Ruminococcus sp.]
MTVYSDRTIYATWKDTQTYLLGDVDHDGNIEIRDATWIQRDAADIDLPFTISKTTADVDGDGNITVMDATAIQYYLANMKNPYNIGKKVS